MFECDSSAAPMQEIQIKLVIFWRFSAGGDFFDRKPIILVDRTALKFTYELVGRRIY
jgi:hypothetical protein